MGEVIYADFGRTRLVRTNIDTLFPPSMRKFIKLCEPEDQSKLADLLDFTQNLLQANDGHLPQSLCDELDLHFRDLCANATYIHAIDD